MARTGLGKQGPGDPREEGGPEPAATASCRHKDTGSISEPKPLLFASLGFCPHPGTMKLPAFWTGLEYTCRLLGIITAAGKSPATSCASCA